MAAEIKNIVTDEVKLILEVIRGGVSITDAKDNFLYINKSCQEMFGVSWDEVVGKNGKELESKRIFYPEISSKAIEKKEKITGRQCNRFGDEYLVTAIPVYDEDNKITHVITYTAWDVVSMTELEEKYHELELYNKRIKQEVLTLRSSQIHDIKYIIAKNIKTKSNFNILEKMAETDVPVFISGRQGTGKTFMANILHHRSFRKKEPFIVIDLKVIPEESVEKEIFGSISNIGALEICRHGTLVIKDIELMPAVVQDKLYYMLENKCYYNFNNEKEEADIRLVVTSEHTSMELIHSKKVVSSLYYAICIMTIDVPPLCERQDDLYEYILYYLTKYNKKYHKHAKLHPKAMDELLQYEWNQNINEVKYVLEKLVLHSDKKTIDVYDLPKQITRASNEFYEAEMDLKKALEFYEGRLVNRAYDKHRSSTGVARELNISQATAVRKLQKYVENYNLNLDRRNSI